MKNLICILFCIIIFSCSEPLMSNWYELDQIPNELKDIKDKKEIYSWVVRNVEYEFYANGFKDAQKTLDSMKGNCANISLLTLALNYKIRQNKGQLVYCSKKEGLHYTVRIDGKIIEPTITEIYNIIEFDDIANYF